MFDENPATSRQFASRLLAWSAAAAALVSALIPSTGLAMARGSSRDYNLTIDADDRDRLDSCDQVKIRFHYKGGQPEMARSDTRILVPRGEAAMLRASLHGSGGMRVQPWGRDDYEVEVCKAAAAEDMEAARNILDDVVVDRQGGQVTARGPEGRGWVVFLILRVPRDGSVELETENGQIDVRDVTGTIDARTINGPIALKDCAGEVRARAQNGPVASSGGSGKQD